LLLCLVVVPCLCGLLQLTDYRSQIRSYVFDVVRATVPKIILDDVFVVSGAAHTVSLMNNNSSKIGLLRIIVCSPKIAW
jgi:hypothetical protein